MDDCIVRKWVVHHSILFLPPFRPVDSSHLYLVAALQDERVSSYCCSHPDLSLCPSRCPCAGSFGSSVTANESSAVLV